MDIIEKGEQLSIGLKNIAETLEEYRKHIYQQKTPPWEEDKKYVDDELFRLQSQIRSVANIIEYMDFI